MRIMKGEVTFPHFLTLVLDGNEW